MKVRAILATKGMNVLTIRPDHSLKQAIDLLVKHNIGALVVVNENNQLIGIISERDVVRALAHDEQALTRSVGDVMTKNVVTGLPQDDLESVSKSMTEHRFRHLPVVEDGELMGIISIGDVVKTQINQYRGEIDTLQIQIIESES